MRSAVFNTSAARNERSPRFPIGVEVIYRPGSSLYCCNKDLEL